MRDNRHSCFAAVCARSGHCQRPSAGRQAFTLVELLVVIAIIGMLVGISLPAVSYSRNTARCMQCLSNLHQIGVAMTSYMDARGQQSKFPNCVDTPGVPPGTTLPTIMTTLGSYTENNTAIFQCPADVGPVVLASGSVIQQSYSAYYGLSYEYPQSTLANNTRQQVLAASSMTNRTTAQGSSARFPILWDFSTFHGAPGDDNERNYLFMDGHADITLPTPPPTGTTPPKSK